MLNLDSRGVGYLFGKIIGHAFILWAAGFLWAVFRYLLARVMKRPVRFYSALLNGTTMVTALALLVSVSFVDIAAEDVGLIVSLWTLCFGMAGAYLSAYLFVKTVVSESPRKINFLLAGLGLILGIISGISALIWLNIPIHYLIGSKNIPTSNATMALAAGFSGFLYGIPFSIWGVRKGWVKAKNRSEAPSGEESSNDTRERGEGETSDRPKQKGLSGKRLIAALSILFLPLIAVWIYGISSGVNDVSSSKSSNLIWCATKSSAFETTEKFCTRGQPDAQIFPTEAEAQAAHRRLKSLSSRVATTSSKSDVEVVSVGAHQLSIPPPEGFCVLRSDNLYERQLIEATAEASLSVGARDLLLLFDCKQLEELRAGHSLDLGDIARVFVALGDVNKMLIIGKEEFVSKVRKDFDTHDVLEIDKALDGSIEKVNKVFNQAFESVAIGETTFLGILAQDTSALYFGVIGNVTADSRQMRMLTVKGLTLVDGKVLNLELSTEYAGPKTVGELIAKTQAWVSLVHDSN